MKPVSKFSAFFGFGMEKQMIYKVRYIGVIGCVCILFGMSGCAGLFSSESVEQAPQEDVALAMKIKVQLIEAPELSAAAIHVEASNGLVVLSGFVETKSQRQLAHSITQQTPNVTRIDNQIQVK